MSPEERRRRGTKLCERLTEEVFDIAPTGIGYWADCWEIVGDADAAFMISLLAWERTGSDVDKDSVRTAYNRVLAEWREAVTQFEQQRQGTP